MHRSIYKQRISVKIFILVIKIATSLAEILLNIQGSDFPRNVRITPEAAKLIDRFQATIKRGRHEVIPIQSPPNSSPKKRLDPRGGPRRAHNAKPGIFLGTLGRAPGGCKVVAIQLEGPAISKEGAIDPSGPMEEPHSV